MVAFTELSKNIQRYCPSADLALIERAYHYAEQKHGQQKRASGEVYFVHPTEVAEILIQMRLDVATIIAGLLHDTLEDTDATFQEIQEIFGAEIADLVEGVTKISKLKFSSAREKQAESFRKMTLAMAKDLRVILIKLADRLNNMRTLQHLSENKQLKIAQETLDIYAPFANRLGIQWIKIELEELSFKYLKPDIFKSIENKTQKISAKKETYINKVCKMVMEGLNNLNLSHAITGRMKHNLSVYRKMEDQAISFDQVHDLVAFRIIVEGVIDCYQVLGVVHELFKPVPGRFKDYIAMPKINGYRSLHTTVVCLDGVRAEFQIRTGDMHEVAEEGIAAHWMYKESKDKVDSDSQKFQWLRNLLDNQKGIQNPSEFLDTVKLDLFATDVYVFTPTGELKELPYGSSVIDFAYSIHSGVGDTCTGAKVNEAMVSLDHQIHSGDTIEILTSKKQKPNADWLKFVKTSKARTNIRNYIRNEQRQKSIQIGADLIKQEFEKYGENFNKLLKSKKLDQVLNHFEVQDLDKLYTKIGYGKLSTAAVVEQLLPQDKIKQTEVKKENLIQKIFNKAIRKSKTNVKVGGYNDILVTLAKCCNPVPGDPISGYITRGRGVTAHYEDCDKALFNDQERKVDVEWDTQSQILHKAKIRVVSDDQPGVLAEMTKLISGSGVNIAQANIRTSSNEKAINIFHLEVHHAKDISQVLRRLQKLKGVISVDRVRG